MSSGLIRTLGLLCLLAGMGSIVASIGIWGFYKTPDPAHAERFGIFVGLWAPTFIVLGVWLQGRGTVRVMPAGLR